MCGIAGLVHSTITPEDREATVIAMLKKQERRGPEGRTVKHVVDSSFGHCGLSYVEPPASQPSVSRCGNVMLVFNGEVYNYRELAQGPGGWANMSESEVLLSLYLNKGIGFVNDLRGMFSFAVVDRRRSSLLLGRDRFGKKPLYYRPCKLGMAFASELRCLVGPPFGQSEIDFDAVGLYMAFGAVPAPYSMFAGLRKVRPGAVVEFDPDGRISETEYWSLAQPYIVRSLDEREAVEQLESRLLSAISRRISGTQQPLGIALSSGVDSSLLAALLSRMDRGRELPAFTVGLSEGAFDESEAAAATAGRLGLRHHVIDASFDVLAGVVTEQYPHLDEPLADPSLIPLLLLCGHTNQAVKGLLGGDGADEVFLGYLSFHAARAISWLTRPLPHLAIAGLSRLGSRSPGRDGVLSFPVVLRMLCRAVQAPPERRFYESRSHSLGEHFPWNPDIGPRISRAPIWEELGRIGMRGDLSEMDVLQRSVICHFLRDGILTKLDRGGMHHSMEIRSPYLDEDLYDWSMTLPKHLLLRPFCGKYLLRRLASRLLPAAVGRRVKSGFRIPLDRLLRRELRPVLLDLLSARNMTRVGLLDSRAVVRLVDEHLRGERDNQRVLWPSLCLHLWHRCNAHGG